MERCKKALQCCPGGSSLAEQLDVNQILDLVFRSAVEPSAPDPSNVCVCVHARTHACACATTGDQYRQGISTDKMLLFPIAYKQLTAFYIGDLA
eukprot:547371-Pelagomonas_calceolata.AAC.3